MGDIFLCFGLLTLTVTLLFVFYSRFWLYNVAMLSQIIYLITIVIASAVKQSKLYFVLFVTEAILLAIIDRTWIFRYKARICQLQRIIKTTDDEALKQKAIKELKSYETNKR